MRALFSDWIGRTEETEELIALAPVRPPPPCWTIAPRSSCRVPVAAVVAVVLLPPRVPQSRLGPDGHPQRGGFMPPIELPRRHVRRRRACVPEAADLGQPARRQSVIRDVSEKEGRTGKLAFVTVGHPSTRTAKSASRRSRTSSIANPARRSAPPSPANSPAPAGSWTRMITPDPTLLFRFSALTFNAHRIHYDRTYATTMEGYPGLVVHGPLTAVLLMELVRFHAHRSVTAFAFRGRARLSTSPPFA